MEAFQGKYTRTYAENYEELLKVTLQTMSKKINKILFQFAEI